MLSGVNRFLPEGLTVEGLLSEDVTHEEMMARLQKAYDNYVLVVGDEDLQLRKAACQGDLEKVKSLFSKEIVDIQGEKSGRTALHYAASNGHDQVVSWLVENGADIAIPDFKGNTPYMLVKNQSIKHLLENHRDASKAQTFALTHQHLLTQMKTMTDDFGIAPPNYDEENKQLKIFRGKRKKPNHPTI